MKIHNYVYCTFDFLKERVKIHTFGCGLRYILNNKDKMIKFIN